MRYDPNVHRRRSIRLSSYDYRTAGAYFVTICTHGRAVLFDDARTKAIVQRVWERMTGAAASGDADEFVVMPNHVHGIIWIPDASVVVGAQHSEPPPQRRSVRQAARRPVTHGHGGAAPLLRPAPAVSPVPPGSLAAIVRTFKSRTTKVINRVRRTYGAPVWQRSYYERVIRNERELNAVRQYIRDNPLRWAEDPENPALPGTG